MFQESWPLETFIVLCFRKRILANWTLVSAGIDDRASGECIGSPGEQPLQVLPSGACC